MGSGGGWGGMEERQIQASDLPSCLHRGPCECIISGEGVPGTRSTCSRSVIFWGMLLSYPDSLIIN